MEVVTRSDHSKEQVDKDMEFFESDLNRVLMVSSGERVKRVVLVLVSWGSGERLRVKNQASPLCLGSGERVKFRLHVELGQ